jgi:hypothetical protein
MSHACIHSSPSCSLKRPLRVVLILAAIGALTGCGNSPSDQAQQDASAASSAASKLLVSAGDYRPSTSFIQQSSTVLNDEELASAKVQAINNPSSYLAPSSTVPDQVAVDLSAAQGLISNVVNNPDLAYQFKGVLFTQQALINLAQADRQIEQMVAAVDDARAQAINLSALSLQLVSYQFRITMLEQQQQSYAQADASDLLAAQQSAVQAQQVVENAARKLNALKSLLSDYQQKASDYSAQGVILRNQSQSISGQDSLDEFRQGGDELDKAAAFSQKAQVLQAEVDLAAGRLAMLNLEKQAADTQVQQISAARAAAQNTAQQDADQIAALQTQARLLVLGSGEPAVSGAASTVNQVVAQLQQQLDAIRKQADQAASLCQQAQDNLGQAIEQQRNYYTQNNDLTEHGATAEDPMVVVTGNHLPEALLQLLRASTYFRSARVNQILMQAAQLQQDAAVAVQPVYSMIDQSSPITAAESGTVENYRAMAINDLGDEGAMGVINQARMDYSPGDPPADWLTPVMQFQIDLALARLQINPNDRSQAILDASRAAAEANRYNPTLTPKLALPEDLSEN